MRLRANRGPDYRGPRLTPVGAVFVVVLAALFIGGTVAGSAVLLFVGAALLVVLGATLFSGGASPGRRYTSGDGGSATGVSPLGDLIEAPDDDDPRH